MVARGVARWAIDSRTGLVSTTVIEMVENDYRVMAGESKSKSAPPVWSANLGPVISPPKIIDAYPGFPVLPLIGYDRRSAGGHKAA